MANTTITPTWVTYEVAMYFVNSLRGVAQFDRSYSDEYVQSGAKVGDTVKIRLPQQFEASEGDELVEQNLLDSTVSLILNRRRHVGFGMPTVQQTTDIDDIRNRYVQPAAETLAGHYDRLSMGDVFKSVYNMTGTLGTTPATAQVFTDAKTKIIDLAGPDEGLVAVLDPWASNRMSQVGATAFHPSKQLAANWSRGQIADNQFGIERYFEDQAVPRFTSGAVTVASTPLVNGAGQTGSSIITDGWSAGDAALKKGDIVTFAGVRWVNPVHKEDVGRLAQFVLTADVTSAAGAATLPISPSIVTSGALQNVNAAPADNAAVTYWGMAAGGTQAATVSPQSLVFHPKAFATVMADLVMPEGGALAARVSSQKLKVALRYVRQFDIRKDKNLARIDFLSGSVAVQARLATRVVG